MRGTALLEITIEIAQALATGEPAEKIYRKLWEVEEEDAKRA